MALVNEFIDGLIEAENDLGNPTLNFQGTDYACIPSIDMFDRKLGEGGFLIDRLAYITLRLLDKDLNSLLNVIPSPQQEITLSTDNDTYRIIETKLHPTGAYIRLICESTTRGL